jgi:glucoamylase
MKKIYFLLPGLWMIMIILNGDPVASASGGAFGAPGVPSSWTLAGKTGIGTAYEQYHNQQYSDNGPTGPISKVWFSIAKGIVTETAFGRIHEAQIKDLQFLINGDGFFD